MQVNEFEVTLERPGAGLSTGSGTVGGARVIPMEEVSRKKGGGSDQATEEFRTEFISWTDGRDAGLWGPNLNLNLNLNLRPALRQR